MEQDKEAPDPKPEGLRERIDRQPTPQDSESLRELIERLRREPNSDDDAKASFLDWSDILTPSACAASRALLVQRPMQILSAIAEGV